MERDVDAELPDEVNDARIRDDEGIGPERCHLRYVAAEGVKLGAVRLHVRYDVDLFPGRMRLLNPDSEIVEREVVVPHP